jgi:hypothetical protein
VKISTIETERKVKMEILYAEIRAKGGERDRYPRRINCPSMPLAVSPVTSL